MLPAFSLVPNGGDQPESWVKQGDPCWRTRQGDGEFAAQLHSLALTEEAGAASLCGSKLNSDA